MKKRKWLYLPLIALLIFAGATLVVHFRGMPDRIRFSMREYQVSFRIDGAVTFVAPEAASAGLLVGDRVTAINGIAATDRETFIREIRSQTEGRSVNLTVQRNGSTIELTVPPARLVKDFSWYARFAVGMLVAYFLPAFCIILGFWVAFIRPYDFLAWLLLLVLLGVASIGLEGGDQNSLPYIYTQIFFSVWAASMFLFGIYFPERLALDRRYPWMKFLLLVPLSVQIPVILSDLVGIQPKATWLGPVFQIFPAVAFPLNLLAIGLFFAFLGYKAGTTKNPDARRRLRVMAVGTSVSMAPSFIIIIVRIVTRAPGSFFEVVPFWFALIALLAMLLFPLTLAYVIVVHRAMDVRVVIRQGLQYALARNGIRALQGMMLLAVILGVIWIFRNDAEFGLAEQIGFVAAGFALIPLIDYGAKRLGTVIDRRFFRDAYDAERILAELSDEVRMMVETRPLIETVSARLSESLHVPQIVTLLRNGDRLEPAHVIGYEISPTVGFDRSDRTLAKLARNEPLQIYADDEESWVNAELDLEERERLAELNPQLLLPLGAKDELSGFISLGPKRSEEPFTPNDLRLLKSVASQTGMALENSRLTEAIAREAAQKERLNREVEIAREVQERLFPQELPTVDGIDYFGACRPALGVGGDYYDFLELPDGKLGIAIGDISGKGIGASLMMASLQASLRGQSIHFKDDLAEMIKHVNTLLYEASTTNRYATFFYARYDPSAGRLIYVNAGHNPPFLIRRDGGVEKLDEGGPVVGMLPSMLVNYSQGETEFGEGDMLIGFTDGISEAMNPAEEEWGEDAMLAELMKLRELPAAEVIRETVRLADLFADGARQHDDMTMVVVKRR